MMNYLRKDYKITSINKYKYKGLLKQLEANPVRTGKR
jgi:hypothetical protein